MLVSMVSKEIPVAQDEQIFSFCEKAEMWFGSAYYECGSSSIDGLQEYGRLFGG